MQRVFLLNINFFPFLSPMFLFPKTIADNPRATLLGEVLQCIINYRGLTNNVKIKVIHFIFSIFTNGITRLALIW